MATLDPSALEEYTNRNGTGGVDRRRTSNEKFIVLSQYKTFCAEAGCRANSAVVRFLESVPSDKPLTEIAFQNFYLGPKGFTPVLELIQVNQTIEVIDLRGNGLDNAAIQGLCGVLEKHLGVRSLYIGGNPISVDGGKYVMYLLEHNRRITAIDVSETNVYESMSTRMDMQVSANREAELSGVTLVPSKPSGVRNGSATPSTAHALVATARNSKPEITLLDKASLEETPRRGGQAGKASPQKRRLSPHKGAATSGNTMEDVANTQAGAPKPRPPPPALVSRETSRWTEKQRQDMLEKYQERSKMYHQVVRSDASRAADRAREELMKIEQGSVVDAQHAVKRADVARSRIDRVSPGPAGPSHEEAAPRPTITTPKVQHHTTRKSVYDSDHSSLDAPSAVRWSVSELPAHDEDYEDEEEVARVRRSTLINEAQRVDETLQDDDDDEGKAARLVLQPITLTRDEQFKELFTKGCQQYNDKQLDAAYLTWNEAMDLAVTNKNREWMSVISNNLQRLSYEILVAEGATHLDNLRLEDADKAFQLAMDVAHKAKNAQWEGEMHRARKNVQHAVFQRSHEAALRLFEKVQSTKEQRVTNDDRFTLPGDPPGKLREYSSEFVTEWTRMLLIKEALEMWADAMMMSRRVSGSSGKVLGEVVTAAVDSVCTYLARKYLVPEPNGNILSLQRTSHFSCHEGVKLIELWTDLVSKTQTALSNRTWDAIGASVLGNLYLATHQLPQALHQFDKIVDIGTDKQDALLLGLGNTYLGVLHWQRSSNAVAEKCFLSAMEYWRKLRSSFGVHRNVAEDHEGLGNVSTPTYDDQGALTNPSSAVTVVNGGREDVDATQAASSLSGSISVEYLNAMLGKCFTFLIRILFSTSRYRDALEMLERGLLHRYKDRLHDKMLRNFTAKPTMDHITAVAASLDSPLVYYETSYRFDWNVHVEAYDVSQQLMVWVVVKEGEMKVVRVDVTNDFGVASIDVLLEQVQNALHVMPIPDRGVQDHIITKLPEKTWREPLAKLYEIVFHPVADFISAHDAQQNHRGGVITVIPSSSVWMVPFNGLIMRNGQFLVETYSIQHAFCSVQAAFSTLSARRAKDRDLRKKVVFAHPSDASHSEMQLNRMTNEHHVPFPIDIIRSHKEAQRVVDALAPLQQSTRQRNGVRSSDHSAVMVNSEHQAAGGSSADIELVDDVHTLRELLPKIRILHIAATNAAKVDNDDGSAGALIVPASQDELALLRTSEVSTYEMMSELVVLPHTNIASDRIRTTREGTLSLCRAFLSAGAAAVIFSRWCTPDLLPIEIFEPFYQLLQQKKDVNKAKAMTAVLRKLLTDDKFRYNPRLWCGFLMVGVGNL
ncbi:Hypothetical protein, putative [Bodo saltans]|uniref:CHAT domain-containing protein n=1 Tax=Bodo saltans TaxID=75058 RepID=A0A0S4IYB6_BODSA|nr:Hypothetical protein, putative [Bodo saltans]|eukprot:CUG07466.1 Hypothetical protein, putative [Bodo saltans]